MSTEDTIGRRDFLRRSASIVTASLASGASAAAQAPPSAEEPTRSSLAEVPVGISQFPEVWVLTEPEAGFQGRFAARELGRGLRNLGLTQAPRVGLIHEVQPREDDAVFRLVLHSNASADPESYEIVHVPQTRGLAVEVAGASPQALACAAFDFLERQGAFFGLDGEVYPLEPAKHLRLPPAGQFWKSQPRFKVRGLLPWPDFLNCVTVYNRDDWRAYLEAMKRMRFNTLGIHVYSSGNEWTESFLSFEYGPTGHWAFTDTTATNRWGWLPERTERFGMGAADFYAGQVFGSEATTQARSCWEDEKFAQRLWGEAFRYAQQLGIRTGVGFEPYSLPEEIARAVPPEALFLNPHPKLPAPKLDPESMAAKDILERRLARLLEVYPEVDYVWLWEDEGSSGASRNARVPLSITAFRQTYDFLRRNAPQKRMVLSGWGGVVRHFAYFHEHLPEDVIFSALNDSVGWDPVSEEFGKLGSRERWPIPWLEDDPAMWLPQLHVYRFRRDMDLASQYGCQGVFGIHWRTRIMNANAGYLERYAWQKSLSPEEYYESFASALARPPRAAELARTLNEADRDRLLLSSWDGKIVNGHYQVHGYTGDYDEAFQYWDGYEPSDRIKQSQAKVAQELRRLTNEASSPDEAERLNYWTHHVEFLVPYSDSWSLAFRLYQVLDRAGDLKKAGKADEAKNLVQTDGVPLWLKLAPKVREAILDFQEISSTRGDLGTLASMHNKYERLALFRLPASIKEYLLGLPPEVPKAGVEALLPHLEARPRVFIPSRPTVLALGDRVRIFAVAVGGEDVVSVSLFTRRSGSEGWSETSMTHAGRRTFVADLTTEDARGLFLDYYVHAEFRASNAKVGARAPAEAPNHFYTVTIV